MIVLVDDDMTGRELCLLPIRTAGLTLRLGIAELREGSKLLSVVASAELGSRLPNVDVVEARLPLLLCDRVRADDDDYLLTGAVQLVCDSGRCRRFSKPWCRPDRGNAAAPGCSIMWWLRLSRH